MGRVKDHYWEEICARSNYEPWGPEPDELEILAADAEQAEQRYLDALRRKYHERSC